MIQTISSKNHFPVCGMADIPLMSFARFRPVGFLSHLRSMRRYVEPDIRHFSLPPICLMNADAGQALLILNFGFTSRFIAVALAAGPMVIINSATGFRRVDQGKSALARSYGATTFQIFIKICVPMAMPMIIVGLMMGAIFSVITAIGAEMSGGGFGLGSKLTTFSSTLRTAEFFAVIPILAIMGIMIYVLFTWLGKKFAGWES